MIEKIIDFSARNRFLVFLLTTAALMIGYFSLQKIPLDAIPDLSDTQVIIYSRWDRSPDIIEDQVTYPIISSLLGAPKIKDIRGFSDLDFLTFTLFLKTALILIGHDHAPWNTSPRSPHNFQRE